MIIVVYKGKYDHDHSRNTVNLKTTHYNNLYV